MTREYRLVLERDETGWWIASIPEIPGCHTHGRTLSQARNRIREALGLWVEAGETAHLREEIKLPRDARAAITRTRSARRRLEREKRGANEAMMAAARALTAEHGLGFRDAAELLGISHQRVQQLVSGSAAERP